MAVKHYYCGKVCFNCIITVQNIKTYFNQSHKLLAIHTFLQHKFGHTVSETSLELQQFCLLLLHCETYYIWSNQPTDIQIQIFEKSMVWIEIHTKTLDSHIHTRFTYIVLKYHRSRICNLKSQLKSHTGIYLIFIVIDVQIWSTKSVLE